MPPWFLHFMSWMLLLPALPHAFAQSDVGTDTSVFPKLTVGGNGVDESNPAKFTAKLEQTDATTGRLSVTATLAPRWHIYSVTQEKGGPIPTSIKVADKSGVKLAGEFTPDSEPAPSVSKEWPGLTIEEHEDEVTWSVPVTLSSDFGGSVEVVLKAQVCTTGGACIPINETLVAKATSPEPGIATSTPTVTGETMKAPLDQAPASPEPVVFRDGDYSVQWVGRLEPSTVTPGSRATLLLTAKPDSGFHVYAAAVDDTEGSTNFVLTEKSGLRLGAPEPSSDVITKSILPGVPPISYHDGEVTWSLPIAIPPDTELGDKSIQGLVAYQACTESSCLQPKAFRFTGVIKVANAVGVDGSPSNVTFETAAYAVALDTAAEKSWVDEIVENNSATPSPAVPAAETPTQAQGNEPRQAMAPPTPPVPATGVMPPGVKVDANNQASDTSEKTATAVENDKTKKRPVVTEPSGFPLPAILAMAMVGGLILNLMPCVLPVVGLKVMAFAQQAGENRRRVLMLNLWYTLGILVVFWGLAALATVFSFSWGQQFTYFEFRFGVTLLVFAMALSFLGVWEIPIPGFVGGKATQDLQKQEGLVGAFFKGIFTTLLATPCSGPLLGTVFAFTLGKSPLVTTIIFSAVGLGMALPYLLIAIYPGLLAFFPKPGAWMDVFKQLLAFLLLGTVVYLFGGFSEDDRMPVFASLIGVWFGCWVVGLVPGWAPFERRIAAWIVGSASAILVGVLSFQYLAPSPPILAWEPYDEARLQELQSEGRTVLIDFTAKWCVNCIVNYNVAINTAKTSKLVDELDAIPMLADWTDQNDEIKKKLLELNSNSIPVLAIYPGRDPKSPIVLRDLVSQGDVLQALRKAGASVDGGVTELTHSQRPLDVKR